MRKILLFSLMLNNISSHTMDDQIQSLFSYQNLFQNNFSKKAEFHAFMQKQKEIIAETESMKSLIAEYETAAKPEYKAARAKSFVRLNKQSRRMQKQIDGVLKKITDKAGLNLVKQELSMVEVRANLSNRFKKIDLAEIRGYIDLENFSKLSSELKLEQSVLQTYQDAFENFFQVAEKFNMQLDLINGFINSNNRLNRKRALVRTLRVKNKFLQDLLKIAKQDRKTLNELVAPKMPTRCAVQNHTINSKYGLQDFFTTKNFNDCSFGNYEELMNYIYKQQESKNAMQLQQEAQALEQEQTVNKIKEQIKTFQTDYIKVYENTFSDSSKDLHAVLNQLNQLNSDFIPQTNDLQKLLKILPEYFYKYEELIGKVERLQAKFDKNWLQADKEAAKLMENIKQYIDSDSLKKFTENFVQNRKNLTNEFEVLKKLAYISFLDSSFMQTRATDEKPEALLEAVNAKLGSDYMKQFAFIKSFVGFTVVMYEVLQFSHEKLSMEDLHAKILKIKPVFEEMIQKAGMFGIKTAKDISKVSSTMCQMLLQNFGIAAKNYLSSFSINDGYIDDFILNPSWLDQVVTALVDKKGIADVATQSVLEIIDDEQNIVSQDNEVNQNNHSDHEDQVSNNHITVEAID